MNSLTKRTITKTKAEEIAYTNEYLTAEMTEHDDGSKTFMVAGEEHCIRPVDCVPDEAIVLFAEIAELVATSNKYKIENNIA